MVRRLSKFLKVFTFFFLIAGFRQDKSQSHLYICKYVPISFSSRLQLLVLDFFQLLRTLLHSNILSQIFVFSITLEFYLRKFHIYPRLF